MSWLTGLAGKAEHLLNNLDQAAGQALTEAEEAESRAALNKIQASHNDASYTPYLSQKSTGAQSYVKAPAPPASAISSSASVPSNLSQMDGGGGGGVDNTYTSQMSRSMYSASSSSTQSDKQSPATARKKDQDEDLFAFLNSSDTDNSAQKRKTSMKGVINGKHSRHSSTSSTQSARSLKQNSENGAAQDTALTISASDRLDHADGVENNVPPQIQEDLLGNDSSSGYHSNQEDSTQQQQHLSALELENRLLKNEVASLNQEMTTVIQRTKSATEELSGLRRKLDQQNNQLAHSEQIVREVQARESDLHEAMTAKDAQLGVLRVRLEEADRELLTKKKTLDQIESEKNRILQDHTSATDVQGQALETIKDKLMEAQLEAKREKEAYARLQQESTDRQSSLESAQHDLAESLASAQKKLGEEKNRLRDLNVQVQTAKTEAQTARKELTDYKEKASRILQSKDKLISSLKAGGLGSGGGGSDATGESVIANAELEELRGERALLREELQQAVMTLDAVRSELAELEVSAQQDRQAAAEAQDALEEQLNAERARREEGEHEAMSVRQELRYVNEELVKQKTAFQSRIKDKETDIERLRAQLTTKSMSSHSESELENRLHALTESLIQKQTMLEALSTEKNSLVLQLERIERQYRELETSSIRAAATTVNMADNDEVRQRLPGFLRESPADGGVTRKVKRAASSIDKFSIRLGVFLRRYPVARVMVICYMVLLHIWVLIVLMTYQPEIHGTDHNPVPPGPV